MNYIKHLTGFYEKANRDNTLKPTHISIYLALFQFWNFNRFRKPISISRDEVMRINTNVCTGVALMLLVEQDKIKLNDPNSKYLGAFQKFRPKKPYTSHITDLF